MMMTASSSSFKLEQICGVLDIKAFQHKQTLFYREFAYSPISLVDPNENCSEFFHHSVKPPFIPSLMDRELWKTFNTLKYKITGLDLIPRADGESVTQSAVQWILLGWYDATRTTERFIVGYKGGKLEKDLLTFMSIPCVNLETFKCPRLKNVNSSTLEKYKFIHCGQHFNSPDGDLHCSMKETVFYKDWIISKLNIEEAEENPHGIHEVICEQGNFKP